MDATVTIDKTIVDEALNFSEFKTPVETVRVALEEFITNRKKKNLMKMFGTIDFDPEYDYKMAR